jgi:SAM-dependent methyltransferase
MLDFDATLVETKSPPLPFPDGSFQRIRADSAFTRLTEGWAEWLLELRRVLAEDGLLVVGLSPGQDFERLAGTPWDESRVGMTVLSGLDVPGARVVFHSEWWLRAHWSAAFEIVSVEHSDGRPFATLRRRDGSVSPDDLERPEPDDQRELAAARANAAYLAGQLDHAMGRWEQEREDAHRELMRRAFAEADLDWARRGPGSPGMLVAAEYEATTSWRITKPLRTLGRLLRRDR